MTDKKTIEKLIFDLLLAMGEDPTREGLTETPKRVAKMISDFYANANLPLSELVKTFTEKSENSDLIEIRDIPFCSLCEHHLLPFRGVVHIEYVPGDGVILGLSKFARIVNRFSGGLQVQERLTAQIANFIFSEIAPCAVRVTIEAEHLCMTIRGVKATDSLTKTVVSKGNLKCFLKGC